MFTVEASLSDGIEEVCRDIQSVKLPEPSAPERLSDDTSAGTDVQAHGVAVETQPTLFFAFGNLIDDVVRLSEVDNTGPLVVALWGEPAIPLGHIGWSGQVVVELFNYETSFGRLGLK